MPCRMFISIGKAIETCAPTFLTPCQPASDMPGHVDEQVVRSEPDVAVAASGRCGEVV